MNPGIRNNSYLIINITFIAVILAIIAYSVVFSANGRRHPVPSGSAVLTGKVSASTGMSRSFSEMVRFNFGKAKQFNKYGPGIFSFFAIQLLLRSGALLMIMFARLKHHKVLILTDATLSIVLFGIFFRPFLTLTFHQLF